MELFLVADIWKRNGVTLLTWLVSHFNQVMSIYFNARQSTKYVLFHLDLGIVGLS